MQQPPAAQRLRCVANSTRCCNARAAAASGAAQRLRCVAAAAARELDALLQRANERERERARARARVRGPAYACVARFTGFYWLYCAATRANSKGRERAFVDRLTLVLLALLAFTGFTGVIEFKLLTHLRRCAAGCCCCARSRELCGHAAGWEGGRAGGWYSVYLLY